MMLLMKEIRLARWGWWFLPLFTGFYTSQVVQDFFHQQKLWSSFLKNGINYTGPSFLVPLRNGNFCVIFPYFKFSMSCSLLPDSSPEPIFSSFSIRLIRRHHRMFRDQAINTPRKAATPEMAEALQRGQNQLFKEGKTAASHISHQFHYFHR